MLQLEDGKVIGTRASHGTGKYLPPSCFGLRVDEREKWSEGWREAPSET